MWYFSKLPSEGFREDPLNSGYDYNKALLKISIHWILNK